MYVCFFLVAITIGFDQLIYFVNEDNGTVELMAILSNPSTTDITVQIISSDVTAISKYTHYYYCIILNTLLHVHTNYLYTNVHYK